MAGDIAIRGDQDLIAWEDLGDAYDNLDALPSVSSDPYLRMNKAGQWIYGAEGWKVEPGSKWAVWPQSVQWGYVCWSRDPDRKAEKLGERMVPANKPLPNKAELPDYGAPWDEQIAFMVACVSGEDAGLQTKYATTSIGGIREVKTRLKTLMNNQFRAEKARGASKETAKIVPIVALESSPYKHQKWGELWNPIFRVVAWTTLGDYQFKDGNGKADAKLAEEPETVAAAPVDEPRRRMRPRA